MDKQTKEIKLSESEIIILTMLSNGEYPRTIAPILDLSHRSVEAKIAILKLKFDAKNVTHLVVEYYKKNRQIINEEMKNEEVKNILIGIINNNNI